MIFDVVVGVALVRPPKIDEFRHVRVEARGMTEAWLLAAQMASHDVVMPVWIGTPSAVPGVPEEWCR